MKHAWFAIVVVTVACSTGLDPFAAAPPQIVASSPALVSTHNSVGLIADVEISNVSSRALYYHSCPIFAERLVDGVWSVRISPLCTLARMPPIPLAPGETVRRPVVFAYPRNAQGSEAFENLPGTFRIVVPLWRTARGARDFDAGDMLPLDVTSSNAFALPSS